MRRITALALLGLALGAANLSPAQETAYPSVPRLDASVTYTYLRANATPGDCGCFNMQGGSVDAAVRVYRNLSAVVDLTGDHAATTSVPGQSLSLLSVTSGPRLSFPLRRKLRSTLFVQGLVGVVHGFDAPFPNGASLTDSANAFSTYLGGGLDIRVTPRVSVRVLEADYGLTLLPNNANDRQNLLRLSAGVAVHLWR